MFDLPDAQAQVDVAQWKPIVAWLEPVLRAVREPSPARQSDRIASGVPPPVLARRPARRRAGLVDGDAEADVAVLATDPRVASALPAAKAANGAAAAERRVRQPSPLRRTALRPVQLAESPRFLHRNS